VEPVFAGDTFTVDQRRGIKRALEQAEAASGLAFHVHVGATEGDVRANAVALLQRMPDPARSVVLLVDPRQRALEVVTGSASRNQLSDSECGLAALAMQGSFSAGDLPGGLISGIQQLGEHARRAPSLHTETRGAPLADTREAPRLSGSSVRDAH
jgi:uncharacterized membrane protein YgcG